MDEQRVANDALSSDWITTEYNNQNDNSAFWGTWSETDISTTKTATVQAGQVSGSHSNFPAYVDLSDVGITTLAEAQSVRVYSDAGLTTELAREIVSATEMHVKIPTMSSSTQIWIDYDGLRADYGVTDTYGRNAVWSDYLAVYHLGQSSGTATDSTSSGNNGTFEGDLPTSVTAQIGSGQSLDGTGDNMKLTAFSTFTAYTVQGWANADTFDSNFRRVFAYWDNNRVEIGLNNSNQWQFYHGGSSVVDITTSATAGVWKHLVGTWNGSTATFYIDGASINSGSTSNISGLSRADRIGATSSFTSGNPAQQLWKGDIDEVRVRSTSVSADWISTEYNNQNDNAAFWGTWTTAGGGVTANNSARRMLLMTM